MIAVLIALLGGPAADPNLPVVQVTADDTVITQSCRIVIPPDTVIADTNNDGVIQVRAADVHLLFDENAVLRGSAAGADPDTYEGVGIRIDGRENVTISGARISGFRAGLWASRCDGLVLEDIDASDQRRARLRSTDVLETGRDWLRPHDNDENEWLSHYGSALYVEDARDVIVRRCRVWHSQNALCLDRVHASRVYDNDFSFCSGWGIAMWRCERNTISRNAIDFCIRGYSHGVYNRGQDSAGILMFEQNNENVIAENSATHGGDGVFGFAGREALGQGPAPGDDFDYRQRGNNRNLLIANDFSYAAAHGIEMTFSFGNRFIANRLVGNAICGVWGGYSQDTLIARNDIAENGLAGYGLERGGVNIDSGRQNAIVGNTFRDNACAVHLWWRAEYDRESPWMKANVAPWEGNLIAANTFSGDDLVLHLRGPGTVTLARNTRHDIGGPDEIEGGAEVVRPEAFDDLPPAMPDYSVIGETRPVGERPALRGRENIVMTEWGPWDHASPLVREVVDAEGRHVYELRKMPEQPTIELKGAGVTGEMLPETQAGIARYAVTAANPGLYPYTLRVSAGDFSVTRQDTLVSTKWAIEIFRTERRDPPSVEEWRTLTAGDGRALTRRSLDLFRGRLSQADLPITDDPRAATAVVATTEIPVKPGKFIIHAAATDAVHVYVDGELVIDEWRPRWHPRLHTAEVEVDEARTVKLRVEHFRISGPPQLMVDVDVSRKQDAASAE